MSRDLISLTIPDLSGFAKTLRADLIALPALPGHLTLLGLLARAAGYQNYQQLKAKAAAPQPGPDLKRLTKAQRAFDAAGRMQAWPAQTAVQHLCLWVFWARLPSRRDMTEGDVNRVLQDGATFGDHVLLRRSLIDARLVSRSQDGAVYRRIEQTPPPEALGLIHAVAQLP
jgi:hypothetical protein